MNTKIITAVIITAVIIAIGSFYGGMKYVGGQTASAANSRGQFQRQVQFGSGNGVVTRAAQTGGFVSGSILSKDPTSVTISLGSGGSKIVLLATSTQVVKTTAGSPGDLETGTEVTIIGSPNSDGSITAQSIQIRPAGMSGPKVR